MRRSRLVAVAALLALVLGSCSSSDDDDGGDAAGSTRVQGPDPERVVRGDGHDGRCDREGGGPGGREGGLRAGQRVRWGSMRPGWSDIPLWRLP